MPSIFLPIAEWFLEVIDTIGYLGIFLAMFIEGIITPIPSEVIMPFAGYLAAEGKFNIVLVILVGSFGAVLGSTVAYYLGYVLGRGFIRRYGKYFGLKEEHIDKAHEWFEKWGSAAIFIGHSLPGARSIISIPAGIAKMDIRFFMIFTFAGAMVWNTFLALLGFYLGEKVFELAETFEFFDILVIGSLITIVVVYFLWKRNKNRESKNQDA